jgi:hypothetical protein
MRGWQGRCCSSFRSSPRRSSAITRAGEGGKEPYPDSSGAAAVLSRNNGVPYRSLQRFHHCHPHLVGLLWLKCRLVHSGHLDFVRGRQATVVIRMSELLGDRRYRSDMRLRI